MLLIAHVLRDKGGTVHTLSADATLEQAAKELNLRKVGALVVVDENGALFGVLSERDVVREVAQRGAAALADRVSVAMSRGVITAAAEELVNDGLSRMTDRRVRHLPVVEGGRLIGIVSIGDLVKHQMAAVEAEAASLQAYIAAQ
jgi:CBS domain-containing protein